MYSVAAVRADAFIGEKRLLTYCEQIAFLVCGRLQLPALAHSSRCGSTFRPSRRRRRKNDAPLASCAMSTEIYTFRRQPRPQRYPLSEPPIVAPTPAEAGPNRRRQRSRTTDVCCRRGFDCRSSTPLASAVNTDRRNPGRIDFRSAIEHCQRGLTSAICCEEPALVALDCAGNGHCDRCDRNILPQPARPTAGCISFRGHDA